MNYAVDREKMKQLAFHNEGEMTVVPYPKTSWGYSEEQDYYTFDLDKAKELLAEAGYPDGFEVPMLVQGTSGVQLDQAQVYQADLAQIGVDVTLEPTELPLYWPKLIGSEFAIVSHGTGSGAVDPSGLWEGAACCRPFRNFFGIVENEEWFPEYEAVITEARSEADQEKRKELNDKALSILMEQGWTMATAWNQMIYAAQDYVHDTRTDMGPFIWLDEAWMSK
jgi:peptide/nickel transport system substrate-binding protein